MGANVEESPATELVIERVFDVPRRLVFSVWSDPLHLVHWWGPREGDRDYSMPVCEMDFRPGGKYRFTIRSPSGQDYVQRGEYREIVVPALIVFTFAWDPQGGQRTNEMLVRVTFAEIGHEKTRMRFVQTAFATAGQRDGHRSGWNECFDRLAEWLAEWLAAHDSSLAR